MEKKCYIVILIVFLALILSIEMPLQVFADNSDKSENEFDTILNNALILLSQFKGTASSHYNDPFSFYSYPGLISEPQKSYRVPHQIIDNLIEVEANELSTDILQNLYYGIFEREISNTLLNSEKTGVIYYEGKFYQIEGWASNNSMSALQFVYPNSTTGFVPKPMYVESFDNDRAIAHYSILLDSDYHEPFDYSQYDNLTVEYKTENGKWVISGGSLIDLLFSDYLEDDIYNSPSTGDDSLIPLYSLCLASFVCTAVSFWIAVNRRKKGRLNP